MENEERPLPPEPETMPTKCPPLPPSAAVFVAPGADRPVDAAVIAAINDALAAMERDAEDAETVAAMLHTFRGPDATARDLSRER